MRYKVFRKLYFCSPVWSSASNKNISKLQKVQNFKNFNARIITNTWKFDHMVGVLAFKCAKGLATSYLSDCFVTRSTVHDRNTRNNDYLNIYSSYQLAAGQRTFLYREQLNSGTHCHVRSLRQTTCVRSKRNFENSFLNHFWSARRVTNWCFYLSLKSIILTFRYFIQYCKLTLWFIYMLTYVGTEKPLSGEIQ